jgi:hypothetical protein
MALKFDLRFTKISFIFISKQYIGIIENKGLGELRTKLLKLKNRLRQFESLFSASLLVSIMTSTLLTMASVCNLSIRDLSLNINLIQIISFINFWVGFIKLLIYFHFGEEISSAYAQLKNKLEVFCSMIQLSNEEWKQWIAIKELEKQFDLLVFKFLKLRRANLLAIGAFLLQYSVILIQTHSNSD